MQDTIDNIRFVGNNYKCHLQKIREKIKIEDEIENSLILYFKTRAEIERAYSASLSKLGHLLLSKKFKRLGNNVINQFPTYTLVQRLAKFSDLSASKHRELSVVLMNEVIRLTKFFSESKQYITDSYLNIIEENNKEVSESLSDLENTRIIYERSLKSMESARSKISEISGEVNPAINAILNLITGQTNEEKTEKYKVKWNYERVKMTRNFNEHIIALAGANSVINIYNKDLEWFIKRMETEYYEKISDIFEAFIQHERNSIQNYSEDALMVHESIKEMRNGCGSSATFLENNLLLHLPVRDLVSTPNEFYPYTGPLYAAHNDPVLGRFYGDILCKLEHYNKLIQKCKNELKALRDMVEVYSKIPSFGDPGDSKKAICKVEALLKHFEIKKSKLEAQVKVLNSIGNVPMISTPARGKPQSIFSESQSDMGFGIKYGTAIADYEATKETEVDILKDDRLLVLDRMNREMCRIQNLTTMRVGDVPCGLVKVLSSSNIANIPRCNQTVMVKSGLGRTSGRVEEHLGSAQGSLCLSGIRIISQTIRKGALVTYKDSENNVTSITAKALDRVSGCQSRDSFKRSGCDNFDSTFRFELRDQDIGDLNKYNGSPASLVSNGCLSSSELYGVNGTSGEAVNARDNKLADNAQSQMLSSTYTRNNKYFTPSSISETLNNEKNNTSTSSTHDVVYAIALYSYTSANDDELSIQEGDVLSLLDFPLDSGSEWIMARSGERVGYVPVSYIKYNTKLDAVD